MQVNPCLSPKHSLNIDSFLFVTKGIRIFPINSITNWNLLKEEGTKYQSGPILTQPLEERIAFVECVLQSTYPSPLKQ